MGNNNCTEIKTADVGEIDIENDALKIKRMKRKEWRARVLDIQNGSFMDQSNMSVDSTYGLKKQEDVSCLRLNHMTSQM